MLTSEMVRVVMAGGQISDTDIRRGAYGIENYSPRFGEGGYTQGNAREYQAAHTVLRARLRQLESGAALSDADVARVIRSDNASMLEDDAQDAEDREDLAGAARLRARAAAIRSESV